MTPCVIEGETEMHGQFFVLDARYRRFATVMLLIALGTLLTNSSCQTSQSGPRTDYTTQKPIWTDA